MQSDNLRDASFRDSYVSLLSGSDGNVTAAYIEQVLSGTGLQLATDERLSEFASELQQVDSDQSIGLQQYSEIMMGDGGLLALAAMEGGLAIPDFPAFRRQIERIFKAVESDDPVGVPESAPTNPPRLSVLDREYPIARNADYIPALSTAEDAWGVSICTVDGQQLSLGASDVRFSIQSCCKPINYCQALESFNTPPGIRRPNPGGRELAYDKIDRLGQRAVARKVNRFEDFVQTEQRLGVHDFVDCEPSGEAFNDFSFTSMRMPYNPMINAGAIMCAALVSRAGPTDIELEHIQRVWMELAGSKQMPMPDTKTAKGESRTGSNNRSLAYKMFANEAFPAFVQSAEDIENVLDYYFNTCALMMNSDEMAVAAATLANRGVCPTTGVRVFHPASVRECLASMLHCGMYDSSGRFGRMIGLPAKSGVGGGIMLVIPGLMGICTFSPRLDKVGNSLRGLRFIARLLDTYPLHMLDAQDSSSAELASPSEPHVRSIAEPVQQVINAAEVGDVAAFERFARLSGDDESYLEFLNKADYDGRTAMHLAACGGHIDVIEHLIANRADISPKDRWGSTPLQDARRLNEDEIVTLLTDAGADDFGEHHADDVHYGELAETIHKVKSLFDANEFPHNSVSVEDLELIWAAARGDIAHLRRCTARGMRLLVADYDNRTPLHLAVAEAQYGIVQYFVRYFGLVDERARLDHDEASRRGYYLSWPDRWGRTPLDEVIAHRAASSSDEEPMFAACEQLLRDAGAFRMNDLLEQVGS